MTFDLYVWSEPRDLEAEQAAGLVASWEAAGGDPAAAPFEPTTSIAWFYRELLRGAPRLDTRSDAPRDPGRGPIVLQTDDPPPARVVAIRAGPDTDPEDLREVFGLAAKYDLVVFDPAGPNLRQPLAELAAHAEATFWPSGAIQAAVAGAAGGLIALVAWLAGIPILSGVVALAGGFMFVMAIFTFVHVGRRQWRLRRRPHGRG